jgi:hypothetical protein
MCTHRGILFQLRLNKIIPKFDQGIKLNTGLGISGIGHDLAQLAKNYPCELDGITDPLDIMEHISPSSMQYANLNPGTPESLNWVRTVLQLLRVCLVDVSSGRRSHPYRSSVKQH